MSMHGFPFTVGERVAALVPDVMAQVGDGPPAPRWFAGTLHAMSVDGLCLTALDGTGVNMWIPSAHALVRSLSASEQAEVDAGLAAADDETDGQAGS